MISARALLEIGCESSLVTITQNDDDKCSGQRDSKGTVTLKDCLVAVVVFVLRAREYYHIRNDTCLKLVWFRRQANSPINHNGESVH